MTNHNHKNPRLLFCHSHKQWRSREHLSVQLSQPSSLGTLEDTAGLALSSKDGDSCVPSLKSNKDRKASPSPTTTGLFSTPSPTISTATQESQASVNQYTSKILSRLSHSVAPLSMFPSKPSAAKITFNETLDSSLVLGKTNQTCWVKSSEPHKEFTILTSILADFSLNASWLA